MDSCDVKYVYYMESLGMLYFELSVYNVIKKYEKDCNKYTHKNRHIKE